MTQPSAMHASSVLPAEPWWRIGFMWLVVGGLGVVVAGSFALLVTAVRNPDTVLPQVAMRVATPHAPESPAMLARNHAATPKP